MPKTVGTEQPAGAPRVAVVVLTWNSSDCIRRCLTSVQGSTQPVTVIVADNDSHDDTRSILESEFPSVTIVNTGENLGYAGGNNVGLGLALEAGYEYVFVLNPDAYISSTCIAELTERMDLDHAAGGASPLIYYGDSSKIWYAGSDISWSDGATFHHGQGEIDTGRYTAPAATGRLSGCAMLVRATALREIGLFDEDYFLYYEETDLSVRLSRANWSLLYVPTALCWHAASSSTGGPAGATYHYYMTRGRLRFLQKFGNGLARPRRIAALFLREITWIGRTQGPVMAGRVIKVKLRAIRDFRAGRLGRVSL